MNRTSIRSALIFAGLIGAVLVITAILVPSNAPAHRPSNFDTWLYGRLGYISYRAGWTNIFRFSAPRHFQAYQRALASAVRNNRVTKLRYLIAEGEQYQTMCESFSQRADAAGVDVLMFDGSDAPEMAIYVWTRDVEKMRPIISPPMTSLSIKTK